MGRALIEVLLERGHRVRALVRSPPVRPFDHRVRVVFGDPLDRGTWQDAVEPADSLVHLVGAPSPNPFKEAEFRRVDLRSLREAVAAARLAHIQHFIYVSVAQPAPIMRAYVGVRREAEQELAASGLPATVLRPWYVIGPGRRWPYVLLPLYFCLELFPPTRSGARRLGLVRLPQMVAALAGAVEGPADGYRVVEVPEIRAARLPERVTFEPEVP